MFLSFSMIMRIDLGRPSALFAIFEPYHLQPAISNGAPIYAGIAMNLRSSPLSSGISGNGDDSGNLTIEPCEL